MKKLFKAIYRRVVCKSNPVTDLKTGKTEIATYIELFGVVIKTTYKAI